MKNIKIILLALVVLCKNVKAQNSDSVLQNKIAIDSILASEQLNKLEGRPSTFYSVGHEVRAKAIQQLISNCILFYEAKFPDKKFNASLYLLNKSDWEKPPFDEPYGMPFYNRHNIIMVVAAEKNALRRLTGLPDDPVKSDSILSTFDYQPIHELGHYFFFTLNNLYKEKWLNEFLATYFLICFIKEKNLVPELEDQLKANYPVAHKTLEDFQKLYGGVGPANYHWYQCKFAQLGYKLYPQFKIELIKKVIENYSPTGQNLNGISLLKNLAPGTMDKWLKDMQ
jgi:hypothetical protein